jgi:short-subunit dehydrogenase
MRSFLRNKRSVGHFGREKEMENKPFANNSVIITGASLGIGREVALQLAAQGALLTLAAPNTEQLDEVAELCRGKGAKAIAVTTDISDEEQCKALIMRAAEEYGRIDTLINNAGIADNSRFDAMQSPTVYKMVMDINFWGTLMCTYYALPHLKQTRGRIVVMNSGAGRFPTTPSDIYCASKHALAGFFDALRMELEDTGVTVTSIFPHWVATGISTRSLGSDGQTSPFEKNAISAEACAKVVIKAAAGRVREKFVNPIIKFGLYLKPFFPKMTDRLVRKSFDYTLVQKG